MKILASIVLAFALQFCAVSAEADNFSFGLNLPIFSDPYPVPVYPVPVHVPSYPGYYYSPYYAPPGGRYYNSYGYPPPGAYYPYGGVYFNGNVGGGHHHHGHH
jgi:hypothetical protein